MGRETLTQSLAGHDPVAIATPLLDV